MIWNQLHFFFFQGRCPLAEENVMVFAYLGADQDTGRYLGRRVIPKKILHSPG